MKSSSYLLLALILSLCSSCRTYKLSSSQLALNPYSTNQQFHFISSNAPDKTVRISKVEQITSRTNPYGGSFSSKVEQLVVLIDGGQNGDSPLFAMGRNTEGDDFVNFMISLPEIIPPNQLTTFKAIENMAVQTKTINGKTYSDVLIFNPQNQTVPPQAIQVTKFFWSKSKGLIWFKLDDGSEWSLQ